MSKNKVAISINISTSSIFELKDGKIAVFDSDKANRSKQFCIAYLPYRYLSSIIVETNNTSTQNEISDEVIAKAYEELALDLSKDYKITYCQLNIRSPNILYAVFAADEDLLYNEFKNSAKKVGGYIDYIILPPFLPQVLYEQNLLKTNAVDCFIFLQKDEAFLTIYQDGKYIKSRQLRYSLKYIYDRFCELAEEKIDEDEFFNHLTKNGINSSNSTKQAYITQIFDNMFFYINDIIISFQKSYGLHIKNIYFQSDIGEISGADKLINERLGISCQKIQFSIAKNEREFPLTVIDKMMLLAASTCCINEKYNYTLFKRPLPLLRRNSGKFLINILIAFIIASAYPAYQFARGVYLQKYTKIKNDEYATLLIEENRIKTTISDIKKEIDETAEHIKKENELLGKQKDLFWDIYLKKTHYKMKSVAIFDLTEIINKNSANIRKITVLDKNLTISARTKTDKKMTELLKDISNLKPYIASTKAIVIDENNQSIAYDSNISVEIW